MSLEIIYEDDYLVAINKPAGLLVHKTKIATEKKHFALQMLRDQVGYKVFPIHRIDRPTSGVLLFAKSSESAKLLCDHFENREVEKVYYAIVRGYTEDTAEIDYALKNEENGKVQEAVTFYKTLEKVEIPVPVGRYETARYSLVKVKPITGRLHQIRKHFGHIRHYIIGDTSHGDWRHNRMFEEKYDCKNLFLHAYSLCFIHPFTKEKLQLTAGLPCHFSKMFLEFNWKKEMYENASIF